ncbi:MAG: aminopeptidase [Cyclobacteriaceae bacterium]
MKIPNLLLLVLLLYGCGTNQTAKEENTEKIDPDAINFPAIAELLIERMALQPKETVLLVAEPGKFDPLVEELASKISINKSVYLGTISITDNQPDSWSTEFTKSASGISDKELKEHLKSADLGVMLPGATPSDLAYKLMQDNLNEGMGRTIHFHWAGAYNLNGAELPITEGIDKFYEEVLLNTDYDALAETQMAFDSAVRDNTIRVTTPAGTDISFEVGDRPMTKQDGDASKKRAGSAKNLIDREIELPAGAIRIAPVESTVNGVIAFPDGSWNGEPVSGLKLTFEKGKVVDMIAENGLEAAKAEIENAGDAGKSFREFALGFNPLLAIPDNDPWIPYYGYGAGVVRLSLGDNSELGGQVTGGYVRWNFFTDATVHVGDEVFVENGQLVQNTNQTLTE